MVKKQPANGGDTDSIPDPERSPGEVNVYPLQYSCLEIPWTEEPGGLHRKHGITESWTWKIEKIPHKLSLMQGGF